MKDIVRPRLGIDATAFHPGKAFGAQTYIEGVLQGLAQYPSVNVTIFGDDVTSRYLRDRFPVFTYRTLDVPQRPWKRILWQSRTIPRVAEQAEIDVFFFPLNVAVRLPMPTLLMVHDLVSRYYRTQYPRHRPLFFGAQLWMVKRSIRQSTRVICPTEAVASEIRDLMPDEAAKVFVSWEAVDMANRTFEVRCNSVHDTIRILVPSYRAVHKNTDCLLHALALLRDEAPDCFASLEVVFTGDDDASFQRVRQEAIERGVEECVRLTGYLDREAMMRLYGTVDLVVFPTKYEGFGLPVIESQFVGVPLLISDLPVLREVSQGHASFFDPGNPRALFESLYAMLRDNKRLRQHKQQAFRRSKTLTLRTWADYVEDLLQNCREITEAPSL